MPKVQVTGWQSNPPDKSFLSDFFVKYAHLSQQEADKLTESAFSGKPISLNVADLAQAKTLASWLERKGAKVKIIHGDLRGHVDTFGEEVENTYEATEEQETPASVETKRAGSLMKRYQDAYLVAKVTTGFGGVIKGIGLVVGGLLVLVGFMVASKGGPRDPMSMLGIMGIVVGILAGFLFFIIGTLVSAQGQILKASLDGAVNSSPFLADEHKAKIMSLPES